MKIKRRHEFKVEVATASLNDIMFFLLLFFLIVSTFANPHVIRLFLPKANSTQTIAKKQMTLSVTKNKMYYIDDKPVIYQDLTTELGAIKDKLPDVTIVVRADATLTIQDLVDVLQIGSNLGIKMILATEKTGGQ
ncbi:MAG TPA: biopolymer transporter ExbD [Bacteroidales bacterium]|nr:biopolymer transporter ExbD [Bacteroidales bacterium]